MNSEQLSAAYRKHMLAICGRYAAQDKGYKYHHRGTAPGAAKHSPLARKLRAIYPRLQGNHCHLVNTKPGPWWPRNQKDTTMKHAILTAAILASTPAFADFNHSLGVGIVSPDGHESQSALYVYYAERPQQGFGWYVDAFVSDSGDDYSAEEFNVALPTDDPIPGGVPDDALYEQRHNGLHVGAAYAFNDSIAIYAAPGFTETETITKEYFQDGFIYGARMVEDAERGFTASLGVLLMAEGLSFKFGVITGSSVDAATIAIGWSW